MLMILTFYLIKNKSYTSASFFFGLLLLCRIDSVAWISVLILSTLFAHKNFSYKLIGVMLALYIPWLIFSQVYFGSLLPHSIVAKNVSWQHLFPLCDPIRVLSGYYPFQGLEGYPELLKFLFILILLFPIITELIRLYKERNMLITFPLFFTLYNLFYSFGRVVMADWYYLPGYITYFITLGLLVNRFLNTNKIKTISFTNSNVVKYSIVSVLVLLLYLGAVRWADNPGGLFLRQNKQLGLWLKNNANTDASVLVEPIGYIGWESNLYIHDYIGLVSPLVVAARKQSPNSDSWFLKYIRDRKPDFIVLRDWEVPRNSLFHGYSDVMFKSDTDKVWFNTNYELRNWNPDVAKRDSVYLVLYEKVIAKL
jgi:hypothetical protein